VETVGKGTGPAGQLVLGSVPLQEVASSTLDPAQERIVDVTYPSAQDAIHVRHSILGDDSVLVKYLNPHVVLITSISAADRSAPLSAGEEAAATQEGGEGDSSAAAAEGTLYWTLLDTVTGKVVLRLHQDSGGLPVHSVLVENNIVSTYWNSKVRTVVSLRSASEPALSVIMCFSC
jgi:hypothetical protein